MVRRRLHGFILLFALGVAALLWDATVPDAVLPPSPPPNPTVVRRQPPPRGLPKAPAAVARTAVPLVMVDPLPVLEVEAPTAPAGFVVDTNADPTTVPLSRRLLPRDLKGAPNVRGNVSIWRVLPRQFGVDCSPPGSVRHGKCDLQFGSPGNEVPQIDSGVHDLTPRPMGGKTIVARYGLLIPVVTCPANFWHGVNELILPIIATMCYHGWIPCGGGDDNGDDAARRFVIADTDRVQLFMELPRTRFLFWGVQNKGCRCLYGPPFCIDRSFPAIEMLSRIADVDHVQFSDPTASLETPLGDVPIKYQVDELGTGLITRCAGFSLPLPEYPFYAPESADPFCASVMRTYRRLMATRPLRGTSENTTTATTTRIVVVRRKLNTTGRALVNEAAVHSAIVAAVVKLRAAGAQLKLHVVELEALPLPKQRALIARTDVLVAARGSATVFAGLMRPGSVHVSLFPVGPKHIKPSHDNYPWLPSSYYREDMATLFLPCAYERVNASEACLETRTVNFCDMQCAPDRVAQLLEDGVALFQQQQQLVARRGRGITGGEQVGITSSLLMGPRFPNVTRRADGRLYYPEQQSLQQ